MRPSDFAQSQPRLFALPAEWDDLRSRYEPLGDAESLNWLFAHVQELGADEALLEHEYLDSDYRDEYRNFYAQTFRWIPDRCERLHFFGNGLYLGYSSIRPVQGRPIGRTMIDPGPNLEADVSCWVVASASPYGKQYSVPAFPFISQDQQYGRCAQATIWMIAHYHHLKYKLPRRFMSDIVNAASESETERLYPSKGLTDEQVGYTFRLLGLEALRYTPDDEEGVGLSDKDFEDLVRRYLNSSMPIALGTPGHLVAVVGAGYDQAGNLQLVQADDAHGAYIKGSVPNWETVFVPLPGRIYLAYEDVAEDVLARIKDLVLKYQLDDQLANYDLRIREYVTQIHEYKYGLFDRELPDGIADHHSVVPSARWIWVVELQDASVAPDSPKCVIGEFAIDATSDRTDLQFLHGNLFDRVFVWPRDCEPEKPDVRQVELEDQFSPYLTGTALNI